MAGFSTAESPLAGIAGKNGAKYAQNVTAAVKVPDIAGW